MAKPRKHGGKRAGAGRKATIGAGVAILVRCTEADRATWRAAAEREGLSLSQWLRAAAELAIARGSTR